MEQRAVVAQLLLSKGRGAGMNGGGSYVDAMTSLAPAPGDLVFFTSVGWIGDAIRSATESEWSHVGVVGRRDNGDSEDGGGGDELMILEAFAEGVRFYPLMEPRMDAERLAIRRVEPELSSLAESTIEEMAEWNVGRKFQFNLFHLLASVGPNRAMRFRPRRRVFCSELVFEYLLTLGIGAGTWHAGQWTPEELATNTLGGDKYRYGDLEKSAVIDLE